ncbi:MAG: S-methyl-5-thioadenosine phosphorylase [Alyxoria varia]|nr:MAG: S-methyl-5-thioadenosine phosphorylase [Alyxoria varia]
MAEGEGLGLHGLEEGYKEPIRIAVIGGTGLQSLPGFTRTATVLPHTPWGLPSSPIAVLEHVPSSPSKGSNAKSTPVAFLSRHGIHHQYAPHEVPYRANMAALRRLGVRTVVVFSAVGSLQEEIKPRDFVLPDQIIDRTKGVRPFTFFENGIVGHVMFADPFDNNLRDVISQCGHQSLQGEGVQLHTGGTLVCMEGPQFSTRAESRLYRSPPFSGSVINMSALPEAKLAREAEMAYQMVCMSTDYDCWRGGDDVTVEMVMGNMKANAENARRFIGSVLDELTREVAGPAGEGEAEKVMARHLEGSARAAVEGVTHAEGRGVDAVSRVSWLFAGP